MKRLASIIFLIVFGFVFIIGNLFKVLHWPGGMVMRYVGLAGVIIMASVLIMLSRKGNRDKDTFE